MLRQDSTPLARAEDKVDEHGGTTPSPAPDYWQHRLAGAPTLLELPTDFPRPARQASVRAIHRFAFGEELASAMRDGREAHSLLANLLAGFSILLSRYSASHDLCIACRADEFSGQMLPLRLTTDHASFALLVEHVRDNLSAAGANGTCDIAELALKLGIPATESHAPLAQAGLSLHATGTLTGVADDRLDLHLHTCDDDTLSSELHYDPALFREDTATRLAAHLRQLLSTALQDPAQRPARLPMLSADEYRQIVLDWNATDAPLPTQCVQDIFQQHAQRTPQAPAVVIGTQRLSYGELNARANQLARYLRDRGVGRDTLVGLCVVRSLDMIVGMLGILKAGGAYLPLDPSYPADRLAYMMEDARPALALTQEALLEKLPATSTPTICLDSDWPAVAGYSDADPDAVAGLHDLAYVIYTSGSTGRPKGVALEHIGLTNLCHTQADAFEITPDSQVLQFASISFDAAVSETFVTLSRGACLHLIRQESLRSSYEILKVLEQSAISVVTLPPSLLSVLPASPLPSLRTLVLAGEAWPPELARVWAPGRRMLNAYGPTEGTVCATWALVSADVAHNVPIGRPLPNVTVYILDEHRQPVPVGVPGELYIGGIGLARAYLNRPELTAERFVPHPFSGKQGDRLYRSGDKARYLPDGNIEFLGRIDNQVKLRGYRIELGEIEAALTTHPMVKDAVVIVREDHPGERRLVAYVISEQPVEGKQLRSHLRQSLPDYMVPQHYVQLATLPLSPNGKVDRRNLPPPVPANRPA
ncbi:non-ribosomal peptide synthetase [Uliginosibacterium sp. H1]|uniref:non-ribosomal peptide synthetase n=1 Tax=Uliginosibacterium sp. H1 TaxID=3114757 RepID=UPI002E18291A|nr:amino acid adenylation domain-containing protein [Uliginosibacterium sp. H1]